MPDVTGRTASSKRGKNANKGLGTRVLRPGRGKRATTGLALPGMVLRHIFALACAERHAPAEVGLGVD